MSIKPIWQKTWPLRKQQIKYLFEPRSIENIDLVELIKRDLAEVGHINRSSHRFPLSATIMDGILTFGKL
jgi:hypothetical protein